MHTPIPLPEAILDALPINVFWKNHDGMYLGANQACLRMIGYEAKQFIGKSIGNIYSGQYAQSIQDVDAHVITTGQVFRGVEHASDRYGNANTYFSIKQPMYDESMKITGMIGCAIEITPSKTTLDARDANQMLSALFTGNTDPVSHLGLQAS